MKSKNTFLYRDLIGATSGELEAMDDPHEVRITNVQVVDFDGDGMNDVLVCNASQNTVTAYTYEGKKQLNLTLVRMFLWRNCRLKWQSLLRRMAWYLWQETLIGESMVASITTVV